MHPSHLILTPSTAAMGPERLRAYITEQREWLLRAAYQGHQAAAWALEAIDTLVGELEAARKAGLDLAAAIPVQQQLPFSELQLVPKPKAAPPQGRPRVG